MTLSSEERDYTTVSIPMGLARKIDLILDKEGYKNRSDFVLYAVRKLLEMYEEKSLP
jgi:metal-responsive CopG/Arc/MetJ family transcriptional regulator